MKSGTVKSKLSRAMSELRAAHNDCELLLPVIEEGGTEQVRINSMTLFAVNSTRHTSCVMKRCSRAFYLVACGQDQRAAGAARLWRRLVMVCALFVPAVYLSHKVSAIVDLYVRPISPRHGADAVQRHHDTGCIWVSGGLAPT